MNRKGSSRFTPIIVAVSVVIGILIGTFYTKHYAGNRLGIINGSSNKLNALLRIIDDQYVDSVDMADLVEKAMPQILAELDPHSAYIPAQNVEEVVSELEGSFSGVGVQFTIQDDTVHINSVVAGGPSEKVGIMAGDRIVSVNDTTFVGPEVTNENVMKKLKGPNGTHVKLGIKRNREKQLLTFDVVRGEIPQTSVDAAYLIDDKFGYVQVSKFGRTTHVELLKALAQLTHEGCEGLIIDLRDNTGGYMDAAIRIANEFLPEGKLIVYAQGRKYKRVDDPFANGTGSCQTLPLVVLINEGSASASEIFAGAIQDNDRGTLVGRRSFGKGLVQQPIDFSDGSAIRLTIARYYTPSGRCIQRPYENGKDRNYEMDIYNRYTHGEFFSKDSIKFDESQLFTTANGRPVYGGGGIMPDVFVPQDTIGYTSYSSEIFNNGLSIQFAFQYTDANRDRLKKYDSYESLVKYLSQQGLVEQLVRFADGKGVKRRNILIQKSYKLLERSLYGNIIYNMLGREEYIKYLNEFDTTVLKAVDILKSGEAFPKAPEKPVTPNKKSSDGKQKRTA
jgi:carboxyl-terminal processing protease